MPKAYGSKEIPDGAENCLIGMTFVFTGELNSISRPDAEQLVKRHGGRVTSALSSKTTYVVIGEDAGPKKLEKTEALKIKKLDEEEFFELIRTAPAKDTNFSTITLKSKSSAKGKTVAEKKEELYSKPIELIGKDS
ncbi:hypothetical protein HK096_000761, partial [Nowakowskiella sp. JEL0078]